MVEQKKPTKRQLAINGRAMAEQKTQNSKTNGNSKKCHSDIPQCVAKFDRAQEITIQIAKRSDDPRSASCASKRTALTRSQWSVSGCHVTSPGNSAFESPELSSKND